MESPTVPVKADSINMLFAIVGAKLADAYYLDQADRILALVGHPRLRDLTPDDVKLSYGDASAILSAPEFVGPNERTAPLCEAMADALVEWSLRWVQLPDTREAINERLRVVK